MGTTNESVEHLKLKLSSVLRKKINKDNEVLKLRSMECLNTEKILTVKSEIDFISEELKQLKNQIFQVKHQISLVTICATSEQSKTVTHVQDLNNHKRNFEDFFNKVQLQSKLRKRELKQNEEEEIALLKQKEKEIVDTNKQLLTEARAVENECENIERECSVLKKRNNAIMLKLRRKLVETENIRKQFKKNITD